MRHKNIPEARPIKSKSLFITLAAVWGAVTGIVMMLIFVSPVIHLKYILRFMGLSVLACMAVGAALSAILAVIQLNLINRNKL